MPAPRLSQLAGALLTLGLLADWVLFEILRITVFDSSDQVFMLGGLSRQGLASLHGWQPLSYGFLHNGWVHLGMNAFLLLVVGARLEWIIGIRNYGMVLLSGLLGGALLHLAISPNILVGGSGMVFAVLLCIATLSPDSRYLVPLPIRAKNLGRGILSASFILLVIHPELRIPGLSWMGQALMDAGLESVFQISHACHLGAAVAGCLCARWMLRNRVSLQSLQRDRARREASAISDCGQGVDDL
ncbi:MAG: rhomboid family intramembrane serine protease [Luteolibacter sp.]|jgi:membrane associated rhomboid family serine protease